MELPILIAALSDPQVYSPPAPVEVRQTHISAVFLVGDRVYKVRKPVNLGFLDFTTLEQRRRDCEEEVRLNRRLAPSVYRGVVPVTNDGGRPRIAGDGEVVEWAVEMVRLPDDATLGQRLLRGEVTPDQIAALARRLADFHRTADRGEHISRFGRFDVVAGNARENFAQTAGHVGRCVRPKVYNRCRELTEQALTRLREVIEVRAARGVPCDTHGDLHLSHVYLFPDRPPPDDLVIIDCIEFAERFRFADPVADIAFLVMDLEFYGRRDLARSCGDAYFAAAGDTDGRPLLPFYAAYRAVVRAKVEGIQAVGPEIPADQRARMARRAEAHWLLALGLLEAPSLRPLLVLVGGLPGTGKSTLAHGLAAAGTFTVLRSDVVRKELAGVSPTDRADGCYTPEWTDRTYAECLRRAIELLRDGNRVIVDASFAAEVHRRQFLDAAQSLGVPGVFLICQTDPAIVRERLRARSGDASDADESVYAGMVSRWQPPGPDTARLTSAINTADAGQAMADAVATLGRLGLG